MRNNTNRKRLSKFLLIMMVVFLSFGYIGNGVAYAVDFNIDNTPINGGFNQDIAQTSTATEKGWLESAGDWISDKWDGFTDWCSETWDDINNLLDDLGAKIQDIMDTAWKWALAIGSAATLAWAFLKKQIPALQAVEWAFSFIKGALRGLADIVIGVFDLVVGALGLLAYIVFNPIESGKKLGHWITHPGEVWNNISNMVGGVWNEITESWDRMVVNGDANSRSEWLGYATTQIVGIFVGTKGLDKAGKAGSVVSKAGGISSRFPLASKAFDAISDSFKGFGDKVKSFGDNLFGNAKRILATTTAGAMLLTGITFVWPKIEPYIMKFSDCVAIQQQDTRHYFASMQLAGKIDCPSGNSSQALDETILPKDIDYEELLAKGKLFASKTEFPTGIDDKVTIIDQQLIWKGDIPTFTDSNYRTVVTNEEITLYRVYGNKEGERGALKVGSFATTSPAKSRVQVQRDSALLPEWGNTMEKEVTITIPKGTTINIGKVAPQTAKDTGIEYPGGGDQILLPYPAKEEWFGATRDVPIK
ncbi:hypothetical protein SAMN04487866_11418 [Thermoactinomyces sp. DSM 45891]|uniref:hypothetical protein n=1 Tax=Thermoactinomyces sp. DSM 45891 TaxID=1761907 RepID=UPI000919D08C|nr:hypothetical protein [Thermoactinomyces sp. DSM 45891]SFX61921.1 hypothetical protein SAMN04487866_11418 [Thermoactinomyces sp. DSM 45891]